jgi:hypothetical protein
MMHGRTANTGRSIFNIEQRKPGTQDLTVSASGLGCMGMSEFYGPADDGESVATIHRAMDQGIAFLGTADMYGPSKSPRYPTACHELALCTIFEPWHL